MAPSCGILPNLGGPSSLTKRTKTSIEIERTIDSLAELSILCWFGRAGYGRRLGPIRLASAVSRGRSYMSSLIVIRNLKWQKSTHSIGNGDCVEAASRLGEIAVRDSKRPMALSWRTPLVHGSHSWPSSSGVRHASGRSFGRTGKGSGRAGPDSGSHRRRSRTGVQPENWSGTGIADLSSCPATA